ncbi:MAG: putative Ig domain-containing protein [Planctomycetota bacterium]
METLEARRVLAAAIWHNLAQPLNVDGDASGHVSALDALIVIDELNQGGGELADGVQVDQYDRYVDVNCDGFASAIDALLVVDHLNTKDEDPTDSTGGLFHSIACSPTLAEGSGLRSEIYQDLTVPFDNTAVQVHLRLPEFDASASGFMRDALEVTVTNESGELVAMPYQPGHAASVNWTEGMEPLAGEGVLVDRQAAGEDSTITIPLIGVTAGERVRVQVQLLGNDADASSKVTIRGFETIEMEGQNWTLPEVPQDVRQPYDLTAVDQVTEDVEATYERTSFDPRTGEVTAEVVITNRSADPVFGRMLVALGEVDQPTASVSSADGYLPDGRPYFDMTLELDGKPLQPGQQTRGRLIRFQTPENERFGYSLAVFGLTSAFLSQFETTPAAEVAPGAEFRYAPQAIDVDASTTYSLAVGPASMEVLPATGEFVWSPSEHEVGEHTVVVRSENGFGDVAEQAFLLTVRGDATTQLVEEVEEPVDNEEEQQSGRSRPSGESRGDLVDEVYFSVGFSWFLWQSDGTKFWADDSDIIRLARYESGDWEFSKYFDGSDVGLRTHSEDMDAFYMREDGSILVSLAGCGHVPGVGHVSGEDILLFTPDELGYQTSGTWSMYIDGRDVGLSPWENVDAISELPDGRLILSTSRHAHVPGISGVIRDEDLLALTIEQTGWHSEGELELYFDGSDVGLGGFWEDVNGVSVESNGNTIHFSPFGPTRLEPHYWAFGRDIATFDATSLGAHTDGEYRRPLTLNGSHTGLLFAWIDGVSYEGVPQTANEPPVLEPIADQQIDELSAFALQPNASDADTPVNELQWSLTSAPTGMTIDGSTGAINWTPSEAQGPDDYQVAVQVSDGDNAVSQTFTISVAEVNEAPTIDSVQAQEVPEGTTLSLQIMASDSDLPEQSLTYSLGAGSPAAASINTEGLITFLTTEADGPGTVEIVAVVTDSLGASSELTIPVTILEVNEPPVLAAVADQELAAGELLELTASATDPDIPANTLTYSLTTSPPGATIDVVTGQITWTANQLGGNTFTVKVADEGGLTDSETFVVSVSGVELRELSNFASELRETLTIPAENSALRIEFETPDFDTTSLRDIRDAFEIEITDASGNPITFPFDATSDASFNWTEGLSPIAGPAVQTTTGSAGQLSTATVNLSSLPIGTEIELQLRLVNNDADDGSAVRRIAYEFVAASGASPTGVSTSSPQSLWSADLEGLEDVTGSLDISYGRTTLSRENDRLFSQLVLSNQGSQTHRGPLVVVLKNLSSLDAAVLRPDGFTDAGEPYYQIELTDGVLEPSSTTSRGIGFLNNSNLRFDYEVQVLAALNAGPSAFLTSPTLQYETGSEYQYTAQADDPDGDELTYTLISGPANATLDPMTGKFTWATESSDVGNHRIVIRASDPFGAFLDQEFDLEIVDSLPNRPPVFVSEPVTEAIASSGFEVTTVGVGDAPAGVAVIGGLLGPRLVTANAGDQTIGVYAGENNDRFDDETIYSTGFRPAEGQLFDVGYSVDIGLPEFIGSSDENRVFGLDQGDLNGDGILDLVSMQYVDSPRTGERYQIRMSSMLGDGIGGFGEPTEIYRFSIGTTDFDYWNLTIEDLDNDGNHDVIALNRNRDRRLITLLGNGDGTFAPAIEQTDQNTISDFVIADVNEDGVVDLIGRTAATSFGATYTLAWLEGLGDGTFSAPNEIASGGSQPNCCFRAPQRPYDVADVNQDGHLDLIAMVALDTTRDFQIFAGDGAGNFSLLSELNAPLNANGRYMMIADEFTGDGLPDIVFHDGSNFHLLAAENASGTSYTYTEDTIDVRGFSYNIAGSNDPIDIDGDGDLDFIFGEYSNNASVKVARNNGSGLFEVTEYAQVDFSGEIEPYNDDTVAGGGLFGDYNSDGVMDLAYFSASTDFNGVGIRLGTRPGEFGSTRTIPWVQNPRVEFALPGDFNGDGIIDLLDTINDRTFLGNGDGTFADPFPTVGVNGGENAGGTADFNLDGLTDFVAQGGLAYKVGLSNGDGTFTLSDNSTILGSFYGISNLSVHDFNNDGYADFMSKAGVERHIDVHLNDPLNPGTFDVSFRYTLPRGSQGTNVSQWESAVDVGDYTGDGILDLIFAERDEEGDNVIKVIVMAGDGTGDFVRYSESAVYGEAEQANIYGSAVDPGDYVTGDIDEDGDLDLLSATYRGMRVFLNDGTGNFTFSELLDHVGNDQRERETWLVDFDEDGHLDIFQVGQNGAGPFLVWQGDGTGRFEVTQSVGAVAANTGGYAPFVDVDGDGHLDFVYATGGNGNYNSDEAAIYAGRREDLVDMIAVDLNGDGNEEVLAIQEQMDRLQVFEGDNLGGLTRLPDLQTGRAPKAVTTADLDGDGQLELLTVNRATRDISLFSGELNNGFTQTSIPAGKGPVDIAAADLDADGNQDVVVLDDFDNALLVYPGDGSSSLGVPVPTALGDRPSRFVLEDATGDGTLDAVVTLPESARLMILPGLGTGGFDSPFYIDLDSSPTDVAVLDLNDDGNPDLAATIAATGVLSIHYGLGGNQFARAQEVRVGESPNRVAVADADKDGRLDFVVSNQGDDTVSVVYNRFDPNEVYRYDSDAIDPDNDPLTYSIVDGPGGLIINQASGALLWAASPDQVGVHDVTISADDGRGGVATQSFKIEVEPARENAAPVIATTPLEQIGAREAFSYSAKALDSDNHPLRYTLLDGPEGASINPTTGELAWDGRNQSEAYGIGAQGGIIRVPVDDSLKPESITVEGWFELTDLPRFNLLINDQGILVTTHETDQSFRVDLFLPGETLRFFVPVTPEVGRTYHIAFTYDDTTGEAKLFIDGQLGGSAIASEPKTLNTNPAITIIGQQNGSTRANIDNYRIWNYPRSEAEIREGMSQQYDSDPRLVLDYRFEDGTNTSSVRDHSIYGNEGYRIAFGTQTQQADGLTEAGSYDFSVLAEDGRGGSDEQSFTLEVLPELRGSISGTVFDDLNSDGDQDDGSESAAEPGLEGWQLFIDSNGNAFPDPGELQTSTDAGGNYTFGGLLPGLYPIRVAPNAGFTTPTVFNAEPQLETAVELDPSSVAEYDVAIEQLALGQIRGSLATESFDPIAYWNVYSDLNDNAQHDVGEPITVSDRNGNYALSGLPAGSYKLRTENPAGWVDAAGSSGLDVVLAQDQVSEDNDFTLIPTNTSVSSGLLFVTVPQTAVEARQTFTYASLANGIVSNDVVYDLSLAPEGMVVDPSSGLVAWRPTIKQVGEHLVILRATDASGSVALQDFTLQVAAPNTAPILSGPSSLDAYVGLNYSYDLAAQDAEGTELTFTLTQGPAAASIDSETGRLTWEPELADVGFVDFTATVTDSAGATGTVSWTVNVQDVMVSALPLSVESPRTSAAVGVDYFSRVSATDALGRPVTWGLSAGPVGAIVQSNGTIEWTPVASQLGTQTFQLTATTADETEEAVSFEVAVLGRPQNSAPEIVSEPTDSISLGQEFTYDLQVSDADGDVLAFTLLAGPVGMSLHPSLGRLRWTPSVDQLGEHDVLVQVSDPSGEVAEQSFTLRVSRFGGPPTLTSTPPVIASVGTGYLYSVVAQDREGDPLNYSLLAAPLGMSIVSTTGGISWTPTIDQVGSQDVVVQVSDGIGGAVTQAFSIEVLSGTPNIAPSITSEAPRFAAVGSPFVYSLTATDPENTTITYSLGQGPAGMTVDANTGAVDWTPIASQVGKQVVTLIATDSDGANAIESFEVDVLASNNAPTISSFAPTTSVAGAEFRYDVLAKDVDLDQLNFELLESPAGATIDAFGRVRWLPQLADLGNHVFELRVTDPRGGEATQSFTLEIVEDNQPPLVSLIETPDDAIQNVLPWRSPFVVYAKATDNVGIASLTLEANGLDIPLDAAGTAQFSFEDWSFANIEATATATDVNGNFTTQTINFSFDFPEGWSEAGSEDIPSAEISSPSNTASVSGLVNIVGTADHPDLFGYKLSYRRVDETIFTEFLQAAGSVVNGELGIWDTSLLRNGEYVIRLETATNAGVVNVVEHNVGLIGDFKLGDFQLEYTDLVVPIANAQLEFTRIYDSFSADIASDFGQGWRLEYRDTQLSVGLPASGLEDIGIYSALRPGVKVYMNLPGEGRVGFTFDPEIRVLPGFGGENLVLARPRFRSESGLQATLSTGTNGYLRVNEMGELFAPGNLPYNPASPDFGGAYVVTTNDGTRYRINGANGELDEIRNAAGNAVTFSDDGIYSGNERVLEFRRDPAGRITQVIDPTGASLEYGYSPSGDLIAVTDRQGNSSSYSYSTERAHFLTEYIDPLGRQAIRNEYGPDGRLVRKIDANGVATDISYDPGNKLVIVTDGLGNPTALELDNRGLVVAETDALGNVTRREFDDQGNQTRLIDPAGAVTSSAFNAFGSEVSRTDAFGNTSYTTYDDFGNVLTEVSPSGLTTTNTYDERGLQTSTENAAGGRVEFALNANGETTNFGSTSLGLSMDFVYDGGLPVGAMDSTGGNVDVQYDALNQATRLEDSVTGLSMDISYDQNGNLLSVIDSLGAVISAEYDANNNVIANTDALGNRTEYVYDAENRLIRTLYADGFGEEATYDAIGRVISQRDRAGNLTEYEYDALGRVTAVVEPDLTPGDSSDNPRTEYQYDGVGRVIARTNQRGATTAYEYDLLGNLVREIDPLGGETQYEYDAESRLISVTDPLLRVTHYEYDALGNRTVTTLADGSTLTVTTDVNGLQKSVTDASGVQVQYEYDDFGRLTAVLEAGARTTYEYDVNGNLIETVDPLGNTTTYTNDALGRVIEKTYADGLSESFEYDLYGNLTSLTRQDGTITTFEYDVMNREVVADWSGGIRIETAYTANGLVQSITEGSSVIAFEYDALDRQITQTDPNGHVVRTSYDLAGNKTSTESIAGVTQYSYNANDWLVSIDHNGDQTQYQYSAAGELTRTDYSNATYELFVRSEVGRLLEKSIFDGSDQLLEAFTFTYDAAGRELSEGDSTGSTVFYGYDNRGWLISESTTLNGSELQQVIYQYDAFGNRIAKDDSLAGLTEYTYDSRNRLVQESTGSGVVTHSYDANGNQILKVDSSTGDQTSFTWDAAGRLIQVTKVENGQTTVVEYEYAPNGMLIARTEDGERIELVMDTARDNWQTLAEVDSDGNVTTSYVLAPEGISMVAQYPGGQQQVLHSGNGDSVVLVTNAAGAVTDRVAYDAYGNVTSRVGATVLSHLYNGERRDAATGLDYLRARQYDPAVGRFISADPFPGLLVDPITMNSYAYASVDPVNGTDPTGNITLDEELVVFGIITVSFGIGGATLGYKIAEYKKVNPIAGAIIGGIAGLAVGALTAYAGITIALAAGPLTFATATVPIGTITVGGAFALLAGTFSLISIAEVAKTLGIFKSLLDNAENSPGGTLPGSTLTPGIVVEINDPKKN